LKPHRVAQPKRKVSGPGSSGDSIAHVVDAGPARMRWQIVVHGPSVANRA